MLKNLRDFIKSIHGYLYLPYRAKAEHFRDHFISNHTDPGPRRAAEAAIGWLCRAQDCSRTLDGGVSAYYSLISGWGPSYPETTGYIIPTMLAWSRVSGVQEYRDRARKMLDWLVSIQLPEGGFQGGTIDARPVAACTFNTGQILLGLAAGVKEFGEDYRRPMQRAALWLANTQDADGCWRKYPSPYAIPGEKTYDTHVAWGLLEAARVDDNPEFARAAKANVDWALSHQKVTGWFENCCLGDPAKPLTHTLGYVCRGILEAYIYTKDQRILSAAIKTAEGLMGAMDEKGFLPGRLKDNWQGAVSYACLTGTAQIALCWFKLYHLTGDEKYRDAAFTANSYVRMTMSTNGDADVCGGVKGSFPVDGEYGRYRYLNWACKFLIDANIMELSISGDPSNPLQSELS